MAKRGKNGGAFEVHVSGAMAKRLREIQRQASREGRGEAVLRAFGQIIRKLMRNPFRVGEELYRLPSLQLEVRCGIIRPLVIDFAMSYDKPLVFIKGVKLLGQKPT